MTASLILRKLGSYPAKMVWPSPYVNWAASSEPCSCLNGCRPALRRRVNAGSNKGEAKNALARAVFFNRLGELRDRSFENQRYRVSGLNLAVAAMVAWNTVYRETRCRESQRAGERDRDKLHWLILSPLVGNI